MYHQYDFCVVKNGIESAINRAKSTDEYNARHEISGPAWNGQAGKAPELRMTNSSSSRNYYLYSYNRFTSQACPSCQNFSRAACDSLGLKI